MEGRLKIWTFLGANITVLERVRLRVLEVYFESLDRFGLVLGILCPFDARENDLILDFEYF